MYSTCVGIAIGLLLTACNGSSTGPSGNGVVRIQTAHVVYIPGDTALFTIENLGSTQVGYNPCPFVLERRFARRWLEVDLDRRQICDSALRSVNPGSKKVLLQHALPDVPRGTYRYRFDAVYEFSGGRLPLATRVSNQFEITF